MNEEFSNRVQIACPKYLSKPKSWRCPTRGKYLLTRHPCPRLDTIYNIKVVRCKCFKGSHPVILSVSGIRTVCLINKCY